MHPLQEAGLGLSASRSCSEAQAAYAALLEQAVSQLHLLGADAAATKHSRKAHQAAQDRLYGLLEALAQVGAVTWRSVPHKKCLVSHHQRGVLQSVFLAKISPLGGCFWVLRVTL